MNPRLAVLFERDFGDVGGVAAVGKRNRNPAEAALRQRFAPIPFLRGQLQYALVARGLCQQVAPKLERILFCGGSQLVDKGLGDESVLGRPDRAPESDRNAEVF